jgi:type IV secretory pathway component VirB8
MILHMETDILKKIEEQGKKIEEIYISVEKTRKYFKWVMIITIALTVLPAIGLVFAIPTFLNNLTGAGLGL